MTIKEILNYGVKILKENEIQNPISKAKIILTYVLNISKEQLIIDYENTIEENKKDVFISYINEVSEGKPVQYITNSVEFMKLNFFADENVLIPRQDTEILIEQVINTVEAYSYKFSIRILDLCTGSGAIAISLARYLKNAEIYATDISTKALEVARINAKKNNVEINFIESDLFKNISIKDFDIIVSNPPYIRNNDIKELDIEVQNEPVLALDGGDDGLDFYKKIIKEAINYLKPEGYIFFEIGFDQKEDVMKLLNENFINIKCIKDLAGLDRVIIGRNRNI